jgi:hypothetical protein
MLHLNKAVTKVLEVGRRWGKALALDTLVPTPHGWTSIGDIRVGDWVFGANGRATRVWDVTSVMKDHPCYEVVFSDGTTVVADAEHRWVSETRVSRRSAARERGWTGQQGFQRYQFSSIVTTEEMANTLTTPRPDGRPEHNHAIKTTRPIQMPSAKLPITPYVFGLWLGDGHSREHAITTADDEIRQQLNWEGYAIDHERGGTAPTLVLAHTKTWSFSTLLKELKVWGNKHIPRVYLRASEVQRLALLQGLMDTDGSVQEGGHCEFLVTNRALALNTQELVSSLGIKSTLKDEPARLNGRLISRRYRLSFTTALPVFRLTRKANVLATRKPRGNQTSLRYVVDVQTIPSVPVRCISVEAKDAQFLITQSFIPTHNSRFAFGEFLLAYSDALQTPAEAGLIPPFHAWCVVPNMPQGNQTWNEIMSLLPKEFVSRIREDTHTIELAGTEGRPWGLFELKSAHDPDSLQTVGLDFLWIQEAQDVSDKAFEKLLPTLRSPGRMSRAVFEGIPPLYHTHWFHRAFTAGLEGRRENYLSYHATAFENPTLSEADLRLIELDRELLPERAWRRMYLAEFSEDAGYFSNITACISGDILTVPIPGAKYVAGLDLGRKTDPSVLTVMDSEMRRVVFNHSWPLGAEWPLQREGVTRYCHEWEIERLVVDATGMGGDIFTSELMEANLPVEAYIITSTSREALLQELTISLERQTVSFPNINELVKQLRVFQYKRLPSGRFKAEAPPGEHDDEVFALALALTACASAPSVAPTGLSRSRGTGRYVPTQEEAMNGGLRSNGSRAMRDRIIEKVRQRQEKAGIS